MDVYNSMLKSRHGRNAISTHYVNLNRHIHLTPFFFGNNQQIRPPGAAPKRKMFLDEPFIRSELEMCMKPNRSPAMKHRRLLTKQKAGCCLPTPACLQSLHFDAPARICQDPQALLKPGWKAVLVSELDSSRLSRELDTTLWSVDWGPRDLFPKILLHATCILSFFKSNITNDEHGKKEAFFRSQAGHFVPVERFSHYTSSPP